MPALRRALWVLAITDVVVVLALRILPCQDLPQHVAYARILADYHRPDLRFSEVYELPARFQTYFVVHYAMAALARVVGAMGAARALYAAYAVATLWAFHRLVLAAQRERIAAGAVPWTSLLGQLLVWSPVACMGFVGFTLAVPLFIAGVAMQVDAAATGSRKHLALACVFAALVASLHLAAAGLFAVFLLFDAAASPRRRRLLVDATIGAVVVSVAALWAGVGESGVGTSTAKSLADAMRTTVGLEAVDKVFALTWHDPLLATTYGAWTVLGPFRLPGLVVVALVLAGVAFVARGAPKGDAPPSLRRPAVMMAIAGFLAPWGVAWPSEITYVNLRVMSFALPLLLALVDVRRFEPRRAKVALGAGVAVIALHFAYRADRATAEARSARALIHAVPKRSTLASLVFHDQNAELASIARVTHFLPMFHTIDDGGIATQFWARYVPHLPIAYKPGRKPDAAPDWLPEQFDARRHLAACDYILVRPADPDDAEDKQLASSRARRALERAASLVRCEGAWCLYRCAGPGAADRRP